MRKEAISSENFHNLLISMAEDMRVVLIIIAYRLYLLRHASMIRRAEDRKELASEVSFLYAPIAHRLGLYKIKGEMEDLCLMYLQPKIYGFITRKLRETKDARDAYIAEFIRVVRETLLRDLQDVPFEMKGRVKSVSSISNKLKKLPFEDIYDVFAIRTSWTYLPSESVRYAGRSTRSSPTCIAPTPSDSRTGSPSPRVMGMRVCIRPYSDRRTAG